ncbi:unnamed protein product [Hymenolepis diminuta]|uniref:DBF4-type domain-containing protein n=1 Tax=Hymenolepis diminuta TaxID=6216 RepID=A0A0R3SI33_HYMDI|nr:unnamed protein product [Hymenolepis diminuta]
MFWKIRSLRGSVVKVTDRRNPFRPLFAENTNFVKGLWPSIRTLIPSNPSSSADLHAHQSHPTAGSEPIRRPLTLTTATTPQPSGQEIQTAAPATNVITTQTPTQPPITLPTAEITATTFTGPFGSRQFESPAAAGHTESERRSLKSKRREEPSGYCELCATHFQKLYEHLHSTEHTDFANNPENFRGIDNALSAFQGIEQDLKQYMQSMVHQPSTSVTQTPFVTPSRSDTGPVAPVSRTPSSPPQHTVMSRQHGQSPPIPEPFPLPPPLTPIHRPPREYADNIPVLFSDDEPSMPALYPLPPSPLPPSHQSLAQVAAQSQEFYDSAGFEPSIPLVPQEEPNQKEEFGIPPHSESTFQYDEPQETEDGWYLRVPYNQPGESSDEEFNVQPESRHIESYDERFNILTDLAAASQFYDMCVKR